MANRDKSFLTKNGLTKSGILEVATNYDGATFADWDWTNEASQIATIEWTYSFTDVWFFTEFSITHTQDNLRIIETDRCGDGELQRTAELIPNVAFTWQEVNNVDLLAQFLGLSVENVAGTPVVWANQVESSWTWNYNAPFKIENQNGDGSLVSITSVTGSVDGGLVANTDYFVWQNSAGETVITVIDSATVTTETQNLTIVYDYTPNAAKNISYKRLSRSIPGQLFKFTTCPDENGNQNTFYMVDGKVSADVVMEFINQKTTDFKGSAMEFQVADGWNFIENKTTL